MNMDIRATDAYVIQELGSETKGWRTSIILEKKRSSFLPLGISMMLDWRNVPSFLAIFTNWH